MITWPQAMQKYAGCDGEYPACATAAVMVSHDKDYTALLYRFQVKCPACGRVREPALGAERLRLHGMELAAHVFPLLRLPAAPPFGAGPAVQ
jgi:hypothetical protein